ncbi:MAG: L-histidine N(alpha)-methyltransferase [Salinivirgaceae bacterium]|jgi:L-histidine N-alpha-methyltransferase|nr:L-histidine N(alpha)-methyltransferase [Salinivirgaceae bacterium]
MSSIRTNTTIEQKATTDKQLHREPTDQIIQEIGNGLLLKQKTISSRFFYDKRGSELFEKITKLPEYYPPQVEKELLKKVAPWLISNTKATDIIELGSGDCSKISILLDAIKKKQIQNYCYYPVDISESALKKAVETLRKKYADLTVQPFVANFIKHINGLPGTPGNRLLLFFGSTIGNLTRDQSLSFIKKIKNLMAPGDLFLIGFDRVKDRALLEKAYNDAQGITAAFNLNILNVINQHIQSNFNAKDFDHYAFYNENKNRIEMHLKARKDLQIKSLKLSQQINFEKGETIHTENSHKFTEEHIRELSNKAGLPIHKIHNDEKEWFSLVLFQKS